MSVNRDQSNHKAANFPKKHLVIALNPAISLTTLVIYSFLPGYKFRVVAGRTFCRVKAGTVTIVVKVGTRTAATLTYTTATEVAATLSTTLADLVGSATEAITVVCTTDGSGALTDGYLTLTIRPYPAAGELGPGITA